jgi:hypothetical protein
MRWHGIITPTHGTGPLHGPSIGAGTCHVDDGKLGSISLACFATSQPIHPAPQVNIGYQPAISDLAALQSFLARRGSANIQGVRMNQRQEELSFVYFPENYRRSHGLLVALNTAPWGGAEIGEVTVSVFA